MTPFAIVISSDQKTEEATNYQHHYLAIMAKVSNKEKEYHISPFYNSNIIDNKKVRNPISLSIAHTLSLTGFQSIEFIRNVTSLIFGISAGVLRLEFQYGFIYYIGLSAAVSALIHFWVAKSRPQDFFLNKRSDVWVEGILGGVSSFVLTWTLFYNLVDA